MNKKRISIIGTGTAGLSLAYLLSRESFVNLTVVDVYDRSPIYGWRYNNSIQSLRNYGDDAEVIEKLKELGIDIPKTLYYPIYNQIRIAPNGRSITIKSPNSPSFYNFIRGNVPESIDTFFYNESIKSGNVTYNFSKNVNDINELKTDYTISAKGTSNYKSGFEIMGVEFHGTCKSFPENTIVMAFDSTVAPGGYIAIIPFQKHGDFQLAVLVGWDKYLKKEYKKNEIYEHITNKTYLKPFLKDFKLTETLAAYGRGGFIQEPQNNIIFIGEQFGCLDSSLGFGNINAIKSAVAASKAISLDSAFQFMKQIESLGVLSSIKKGIKRRYLMRIIGDDYYNNLIDDLIKKWGEEINITDYNNSKNIIPLYYKIRVGLRYLLHKFNPSNE